MEGEDVREKVSDITGRQCESFVLTGQWEARDRREILKGIVFLFVEPEAGGQDYAVERESL